MVAKEEKQKEKASAKAKKMSTKKASTKKTPTKKIKTDKKTKQIQELGEKLNELNDKYLRLNAEFDNYRRRTIKEKSDLIKNAGEDILVNILPLMDNFERAIKSIEESKEIDAVKEGILLIYNNFKEFLIQKGIKEIPANNETFNTDLHEAIAKIPAPNEDLKGKIVDVTEKGYRLNEKVIRFSKVVVGE